MREIKFRAFDADSGKMFEPDGILADGRPFIKGPAKGTVTAYEIPVMMFTGLKDADGVEIFESDVVEFTYWWFDGNPAESLLTGEIIYLPDCMSFGLRGVKNKDWLRHIGEGDSDTSAFATWLFDEADFRVIGNIHQHPDLLK